MSLCTVENLRSILGVGALHTDTVLQDVCDAADEVLLPMLEGNRAYNLMQGISSNVATLHFAEALNGRFYVGQSVTVTGNGTTYNGTRTITGVGYNTITFALTAADDLAHTVSPFGTVTGATFTDYALDVSVIKAAEAIAVDIWQARNTAGAASVGLDGMPMPYKLGVSLLSRVRALITHAIDPTSLAH